MAIQKPTTTRILCGLATLFFMPWTPKVQAETFEIRPGYVRDPFVQVDQTQPVKTFFILRSKAGEWRVDSVESTEFRIVMEGNEVKNARASAYVLAGGEKLPYDTAIQSMIVVPEAGVRIPGLGEPGTPLIDFIHQVASRESIVNVGYATLERLAGLNGGHFNAGNRLLAKLLEALEYRPNHDPELGQKLYKLASAVIAQKSDLLPYVEVLNKIDKNPLVKALPEYSDRVIPDALAKAKQARLENEQAREKLPRASEPTRIAEQNVANDLEGLTEVEKNEKVLPDHLFASTAPEGMAAKAQTTEARHPMMAEADRVSSPRTFGRRELNPPGMMTIDEVRQIVRGQVRGGNPNAYDIDSPYYPRRGYSFPDPSGRDAAGTPGADGTLSSAPKLDICNKALSNPASSSNVSGPAQKVDAAAASPVESNRIIRKARQHSDRLLEKRSSRKKPML